MPTLNFAHRGGAGLYPENTLAAFRDAVARGCDGGELDVQLSRDGEVVVFHDYRLKPEICRLGGAWIEKPTPRIKDLTLAELRTYDVGRHNPDSAYAKARPHSMPVDGEKIPTLAEILEVTSQAKKPFTLQVEFKTSFFDRDVSSDPVSLTEATVAVLRKANYLDRTIFVGFDWAGLLHAKKIVPGAECWFTTMELDFLRPYLEIEKVRFQERLSVVFAIPPELLEARVPNLILQPLVENAIRHGIAPRTAPGHIRVSAVRDGETLHLEVRDNGGGLFEGRAPVEGIGLGNTRARLERLYGAGQSFTLVNLPEGGLAARVSLPLRTTVTG